MFDMGKCFKLEWEINRLYSDYLIFERGWDFWILINWFAFF